LRAARRRYNSRLSTDTIVSVCIVVVIRWRRLTMFKLIPFEPCDVPVANSPSRRMTRSARARLVPEVSLVVAFGSTDSGWDEACISTFASMLAIEPLRSRSL
jgi:hypothetical protein